MPTSIALVPAAMPASIDTKTPPRYSACTRIATNARSAYSRGVFGHVACVASATTDIRAATSTNRHARNA